MEHIPYGYRIENGTAVIDEMAAEQVKRMFVNYLNGDSLIKAAENAALVYREIFCNGFTNIRKIMALRSAFRASPGVELSPASILS